MQIQMEIEMEMEMQMQMPANGKVEPWPSPRLLAVIPCNQ